MPFLYWIKGLLTWSTRLIIAQRNRYQLILAIKLLVIQSVKLFSCFLRLWLNKWRLTDLLYIWFLPHLGNGNMILTTSEFRHVLKTGRVTVIDFFSYFYVIFDEFLNIRFTCRWFHTFSILFPLSFLLKISFSYFAVSFWFSFSFIHITLCNFFIAGSPNK